MQISIVIEVDRPEEDHAEICDGILEAALVVVGHMREFGSLWVDQEHYVTEKVLSPIIGQVSYFRPQ